MANSRKNSSAGICMPVLLIAVTLLGLFRYPLTAGQKKNCKMLSDCRKALRKNSPFSVNFSQKMLYEEEFQIEESGSIAFLNEKRMRWTYNKPDFKVFLINNGFYSFYEEDMGQLTRGKISDQQGNWIWQLLYKDTGSMEVRCFAKKKRIDLKNPDSQSTYELYLDSRSLPEHLIQRDITGAVYIYRFFKYRFKVNLPENIWIIDVPDDTEIIDDSKG